MINYLSCLSQPSGCKTRLQCRHYQIDFPGEEQIHGVKWVFDAVLFLSHCCRYFTFLVECQNPKACTILLRGASKDILMEVERNLNDAMQVARNVMVDAKLVAGGGAVEMAVAQVLTGCFFPSAKDQWMCTGVRMFQSQHANGQNSNQSCLARYKVKETSRKLSNHS